MAPPEYVPSIRKFVRKAYHEKIEGWITLRNYLRQRRCILSNPKLIVERLPSKSWKAPLQFAIYGTLLVSGVVQVAEWGVAKAIGLEQARISPSVRDASERVDEAKKNIGKLEKGEGWFLNSREETISVYRHELMEAEQNLRFSEESDKAQKALLRFSIPISLLLVCKVFAFLMRGSDEGGAPDIGPQTAYLYVVTSCFLGLTLLDSVATGVITDFGSLLFERKSLSGDESDLYSGLELLTWTKELLFLPISIPILFRVGRLLRNVGYRNMYFAQVSTRISVAQFVLFGVWYFTCVPIAWVYALIATKIAGAFS